MNGAPRLPSSGPEREQLRQKGQFWTPDWVAEAMVTYPITRGQFSLFDPAVGAGAFFRAAREVARAHGHEVRLSGTELDPDALGEARRLGLSSADLADVELRDFVLDPPEHRLKGIVANPPYLRHHRLAPTVKCRLRELGTALLGRPLDGRAGLHVYFLLRALQLLEKGGKLAFIVPADTCEGVFAEPLWNWIAARFRLEAVVTFAPNATPFPGVDVNAVVLMISNEAPTETLYWARCLEPDPRALADWVAAGFGPMDSLHLQARIRQLKEALSTGLSRPHIAGPANRSTLGEFAAVMRGIATGSNDFFFLTSEQARDLQVPPEFLVRAVGRTRDVVEPEVTEATLRRLEAEGRPTWLLSLDGRPISQFPPAVQAYLAEAVAAGVSRRSLVSMRDPWYKMEVRRVPPILFAYLGRRNVRFIRNRAGVVPLTGFLCIYPHDEAEDYVDALWEVLSHPRTVENLALVGKSYGSGAIKVEPRGLERLPLPDELVAESGLAMLRPRRLSPAAEPAGAWVQSSLWDDGSGGSEVPHEGVALPARRAAV